MHDNSPSGLLPTTPSHQRHSLCHDAHPAQDLTDPDKIAHCRTVAERGLSDLQVGHVGGGALS